MKNITLDRLPMMAAIVVVFLILAACAIPLRDDANQNTSTPIDQASDPLTTKLAACRSVTSEQRDALSECRKAWTEQRRQFLKQSLPKTPEADTSRGASPLFVPPEDGSEPRRGPPGHNPFPQSGKE